MPSTKRSATLGGDSFSSGIAPMSEEKVAKTLVIEAMKPRIVSISSDIESRFEENATMPAVLEKETDEKVVRNEESASIPREKESVPDENEEGTDEEKEKNDEKEQPPGKIEKAIQQREKETDETDTKTEDNETETDENDDSPEDNDEVPAEIEPQP